MGSNNHIESLQMFELEPIVEFIMTTRAEREKEKTYENTSKTFELDDI